jgi:hypothetical protein
MISMSSDTPACPVCGTGAVYAELYVHLQTCHQKSAIARSLLHLMAPHPPRDLSFFVGDGSANPETGIKGAGTSVWDRKSERKALAEGGERPLSPE